MGGPLKSNCVDREPRDSADGLLAIVIESLKPMEIGLVRRHFSFALLKTDDIETPRSGRPHVPDVVYAGFKERGYGGIGRRTRFRFWRRELWGFESLYPHHESPGKPGKAFRFALSLAQA